ncbi:MAG: hypothetical protein A2Y80_07550 [Deltaproteobacteria bacterium RBG_13_58_19]|nr:MAG: hypothetical protein A2Y80_07550 [Deltaproteobacteria bacterium RBG_13_58_19]
MKDIGKIFVVPSKWDAKLGRRGGCQPPCKGLFPSIVEKMWFLCIISYYKILMETEMKGQWIGKFSEITSSGNKITGSVIINIDEAPTHYQGVATLIEDDPKFPDIYAFFMTNDKSRNFIINRVAFLPINPENGMPVKTADDWGIIKQRYGVEKISNMVEVQGTLEEDKLMLRWTSESGAKGNCVFNKSKAGEPSEYKPTLDINDWNDYKNYVNDLEDRRFIFRGHKDNRRRLRTTFHRGGRADLNKFEREDIETLHKHLCARTRHFFDLKDPKENGAFHNLIRHHGYPTPLLDWTYSPYVAAFFAYREITNSDASKAGEDKKVRIFIFDQEEWQKDFNRVNILRYSYPYISILDALAIDNERMIPQQAVSTMTNIDDIEDFIRRKESEKNKKYLEVVDMPLKYRKKVMQELSRMGITAGSLFPGLDGACEELKERFFDI